MRDFAERKQLSSHKVRTFFLPPTVFARQGRSDLEIDTQSSKLILVETGRKTISSDLTSYRIDMLVEGHARRTVFSLYVSHALQSDC